MEHFKNLIATKLAETAPALCIFCFRSKERIEEVKKMHVASGQPETDEYRIKTGLVCSYAFHHEYNEQIASKPKQVAKSSKEICGRCNLHLRNPASKMNGCEHEYPE